MDIRKWLHSAASCRPPPAPSTEDGENAPGPSAAASEEQESEPPCVNSHDEPASLRPTCGRAPIKGLGPDQPNHIALLQYPASNFSSRKR